MAEQMNSEEFRALTARSRAGSKAKANGDIGEAKVLKICAEYLAQGIAKLEKVDPPTQVIPGPKPRIVYLASPFLDLVGTWTAKEGKALFLEVKSTAKHRLAIERANGVTKKQVESLRKWSKAGASVSVLWIFESKLKVITLEDIEAAITEGSPSIKWDDFEDCPRDGTWVEFDFLKQVPT